MNRLAGKVICAALAAALLSIPLPASKIQAQEPQTVSIGLFFNDPAAYTNTAVSSFTASADKGMEFGMFSGGNFTVLGEEPTANSITVRKDWHFTASGGKFNEYNPEATVPQGDKVGPFHVKIGDKYNDSDEVNAQINKILQKGVEVYPVYADGWQIWSGFYTDQNAAQSAITDEIKSKLGDGAYSVVQPSERRIVITKSKGETMLIYDSSQGTFQIHPKKENNPYILKVNGVSYRGDIEVRRYSDSDMTVINVLPMEQYLYGVVPGEIEAYSHMEALKAQAVAARTYTLNNLGKHRKYGFDLCNTTSCQVYKGFSKEAQSTNKAIDETKGKKLTHNGKLAQVFYFSSSGGRTEDVKNVWGSDIPYLRGVEDKYESGKSWNYNWEITFTSQRIKEIMLSRKYDLGDIIGVYVTKTSEAGRPIELVIKGTKGERVYTNNGTRSAFSLNSQMYTITTDAGVSVSGTDSGVAETQLIGKKVMTSAGLKTISMRNDKAAILGSDGKQRTIPIIPTTYKFTGRGWGHAVGMSQEGAKGMANQGYKYDEILTHYFQGTKVE